MTLTAEHGHVELGKQSREWVWAQKHLHDVPELRHGSAGHRPESAARGGVRQRVYSHRGRSVGEQASHHVSFVRATVFFFAVGLGGIAFSEHTRRRKRAALARAEQSMKPPG